MHARASRVSRTNICDIIIFGMKLLIYQIGDGSHERFRANTRNGYVVVSFLLLFFLFVRILV